MNLEKWGLTKEGEFISATKKLPFEIGSSDVFGAVMADINKARKKSILAFPQFQRLFVPDEVREKHLLLMFIADLMP